MKLDGDARSRGDCRAARRGGRRWPAPWSAEPDVLLLDEPTNHLDLPTIEWLEDKLVAWKGAYVLVSHDRRFLANLSRAVLWLDRGIVRRLDQGYAAFEDWSNEILEREATERHKLDRLIERETEWAGKSIRARRTRNEGRLRALGDAAQAAPPADRPGRPRHHRGRRRPSSPARSPSPRATSPSAGARRRSSRISRPASSARTASA